MVAHSAPNVGEKYLPAIQAYKKEARFRKAVSASICFQKSLKPAWTMSGFSWPIENLVTALPPCRHVYERSFRLPSGVESIVTGCGRAALLLPPSTLIAEAGLRHRRSIGTVSSVWNMTLT